MTRSDSTALSETLSSERLQKLTVSLLRYITDSSKEVQLLDDLQVVLHNLQKNPRSFHLNPKHSIDSNFIWMINRVLLKSSLSRDMYERLLQLVHELCKDSFILAYFCQNYDLFVMLLRIYECQKSRFDSISSLLKDLLLLASFHTSNFLWTSTLQTYLEFLFDTFCKNSTSFKEREYHIIMIANLLNSPDVVEFTREKYYQSCLRLLLSIIDEPATKSSAFAFLASSRLCLNINEICGPAETLFDFVVRTLFKMESRSGQGAILDVLRELIGTNKFKFNETKYDRFLLLLAYTTMLLTNSNSNDTLTYKVCSLLLEAMNNINGFAKQLWFVLFQTDETDKHFLDKYNLKPQQQNNILMSILKSCTKFDHLHDGSSCPVAWQLLANLFEVMKYENFDWSTIWPKLSLAILDVLNYSINFDERCVRIPLRIKAATFSCLYHLLTWEQTKIKLEIEQFIKTHQKLIEKCLYDQLSHNPFCSQGIFDVATDNWSHDGLDVVLRCSKLLMKTMPCIDSPVQKRALAQCFIAAMRSNNCNLAKQSLKLIHHPQFSLISFDELFSVIDDTQCSPDIIYHPSPSTLDDMSKLKNELPSCSSTTSVSVDFARITTAFCKELESRSTDDIDQNELECRQSMIKQIKAVLESNDQRLLIQKLSLQALLNLSITHLRSSHKRQDRFKTDYSEIVNMNEKLRDELGKVKQERDDLDSCLEQFQTQLHNAEDEKTKLHAEIDYLKELVETKNQRIKKVEQERESIVSVIKGLATKSGSLPM